MVGFEIQSLDLSRVKGERTASTSEAAKDFQGIGSIIVGDSNSLQCGCTITVFLVTQAARSVIIHVSRPANNKNVPPSTFPHLGYAVRRCSPLNFGQIFALLIDR